MVLLVVDEEIQNQCHGCWNPIFLQGRRWKLRVHCPIGLLERCKTKVWEMVRDRRACVRVLVSL
eukprot:scaffold2287_cov181-Skeletonema_marinoi.AAC.1